MRQIIILFSLAILLVACQGRSACTAYTESHSSQKATVAVLPVMSKANTSYSWDVGQEVREQLSAQLNATGEFSLVDEETVNSDFASLKGAHLFGHDVSFAKHFSACDYLVVTEIVDHKTVPYENHDIKPLYATVGDVSDVLTIMVRLRVIDMRSSTPKVILQEIVPSNHQLAKHTLGIDYSETKWGTAGYSSTPVGIAHTRLARDVAERVQQYIDTDQR